MDDQEYGPAQPLVDVVKGAYKKFNDLTGRIPTPGYKPPDDSKPDTSWHDQKVQEATKTFATQTAAQKKATPAQTPGKTVTQKPSPRKR